VYKETMIEGKYGRRGAPWEFNLRDILRSCEVIAKYPHAPPAAPVFLDLIYLQRMRTAEDRVKIIHTYQRVFQQSVALNNQPAYHITPTHIQVAVLIVT
jgi:midasin